MSWHVSMEALGSLEAKPHWEVKLLYAYICIMKYFHYPSPVLCTPSFILLRRIRPVPSLGKTDWLAFPRNLRLTRNPCIRRLCCGERPSQYLLACTDPHEAMRQHNSSTPVWGHHSSRYTALPVDVRCQFYVVHSTGGTQWGIGGSHWSPHEILCSKERKPGTAPCKEGLD
jgi:hypothetical protein